MRSVLAFLVVLAAAGPALAASCTSGIRTDLCARATALAADLSPELPREIAPGIRLQDLHDAGSAVVFDLLVAADLRLPDATGFATLSCADPRIAAFVRAGGKARYMLNGREIAVVSTCKEVP